MCGPFMSKELAAQFNKVSNTAERFHIHVYFDPGTPSEKVAQELVDRLKQWYPDKIESTGRVGRVGPHTKPNFEADTTVLDAWSLREILETIEWDAKENGLSVLVHQDTGNFLKDHTQGAIWIGEPVAFHPPFVARFQPPKDNSPKS